MKQYQKSLMEHAIERVALQYESTADEVRKNMMEALAVGRASADPDVRRTWAQVPCQGDVPSVEDVLAYILARVK